MTAKSGEGRELAAVKRRWVWCEVVLSSCSVGPEPMGRKASMMRGCTNLISVLDASQNSMNQIKRPEVLPWRWIPFQTIGHPPPFRSRYPMQTSANLSPGRHHTRCLLSSRVRMKLDSWVTSSLPHWCNVQRLWHLHLLIRADGSISATQIILVQTVVNGLLVDHDMCCHSQVCSPRFWSGGSVTQMSALWTGHRVAPQRNFFLATFINPLPAHANCGMFCSQIPAFSLYFPWFLWDNVNHAIGEKQVRVIQVQRAVTFYNYSSLHGVYY